MIKIDRKEIENLKRDIQTAMQTATTVSNEKIRAPMLDDKALARCAMIALQLATMEALGENDVCTPSDIIHRTNFGVNA